MKKILIGVPLLFLHLSLSAAVDVAIGLNFPGTIAGVDSFSVPSDCNGAIGPGHFVELVNGHYAVYNRTNGARLASSTDLGFWISAGVTFPSGVDVTDPRVIYDKQSGRWLACQVDYKPLAESSNRFLIAVSKTADPTAGWQGFAFVADPATGQFADFPTFGLDADGVYLGADMFKASGTFNGVMLVSIPKADLLAATPTISRRTSFGTLPVSGWGFTPQPVVKDETATGAESILAVESSGIDFAPHSLLKRAVIQNAAGPGATLSAATNISTAATLVPLNPFQPNGTNTLDDGDLRFSATCYQAGEIIYAVQCVDVGSTNSPLAALRWYKIAAANNTVIQSGTISNSAVHYFFPSIAANTSGVVVIGFNGCGTNTFISSYAVAGETVNGTTTFGPPLLLKSGTASYSDPDTSGISRWGDYSATTPDPNDPNHFWTIQNVATGPTRWATQITELIVTPVTSPPLFIARSGANLLISWPTNAFGFTLESAGTLPSATWNSNAPPAIISNGAYTVTLPVAGSANFFRLRRQLSAPN